MTTPDLIIFALNDVLADTRLVTARAIAEILGKAGFEIPPEDILQRYDDLDFRSMLLDMERKADIPFKASLFDEAEKLINDRLSRDVYPVDGALRVASAIPRRCICSNSSAERLELVVSKTGLMPLFRETAFSASAQKTGKPSPDIFLHAAETLNAAPSRCFVVEASVIGVTGAVAAGMRVIGFTGGSGSYPGHADRLTDAGAETAISRWSGFLPVLHALTEWREN